MPVGDDDTLAGSSLPSGTATSESEAGELIAGRYKIVRWIGGGGMGRVYEAFDNELEERIALKVLKAGLSADAIERFRREVKLTRRIQHRNVARMHDIGDHDGEKFLTMELIDGQSLTGDVGMAPMTWERLRSVAEQMCDGLAAAHAAGVIHRDLKPDNVMVERVTGRVVITDFGIARSEDDPGVTRIGAVIGTPRYMAPEQLAGAELDGRSDLFALGVMLFELATGRRPWDGDTAVAIAVAQATQPPRSLDTATTPIPASFIAVIAACLQLDPAKRPAGAAEVRAAIAAGGEPVSSAGAETRASRSSKPRRTLTPPPPSQAITLAEPTTLAVVPIACAPNDEYLADGLVEDMIDTLSGTVGLRVRPAGIARTRPEPDPRELGARLEVDHVVIGSLRRTAAGLRVSARLISVADGFQIWAHRADCNEAEILELADEIAGGIAAALSARASSSPQRTDPRAVDLYLRAKAELRRYWGNHALAAADLLSQAAEYGPVSSPILGALAFARVHAWVMRSQADLAPAARAALERGLATGHGEAYLASAIYKVNSGDPIGGGSDLGIALVRSPMSAIAHETAGRILVEVSTTAEARHHFEIALGLDPGRIKVIATDLARLEGLEGKWDSADERLLPLVNDPDPSIAQLGAVFEARLQCWRGQREQMLVFAEKFVPRMGGNAARIADFVKQATVTGRVDPAAWEGFLAIYANRNADMPTRQQLFGLQLLTEIALMFGDRDAALATLSRAVERGLMDIVWLDHCQALHPLYGLQQFYELRLVVAERATAVLGAIRSAS